MALWDDIKREIDAGRITEPFCVRDLCRVVSGTKFVIGGSRYSLASIRTSLPNYCSSPPGEAVKNGAAPRFERVQRGMYRLLQRGVSLHQRTARSNQVTSAESGGDDACKSRLERYTRRDYITQAEEFIEWLVLSLSEFPGAYVHHWRARSGPHKSGFPLDSLWACTSLFSAYQQYIWPAQVSELADGGHWQGRTFEESESCLNRLGEELNEALRSGQGGKARELCAKVFEWGGVDNREKVAPNIKRDIRDRDLVRHLQETRDHLNSLFTEGIPVSYTGFVDSNNNALVVDSGTTKVYSLLCDRFVIYDGRVASALAYLVRLWWEEKNGPSGDVNYQGIPACLRFSYDPVISNKTKIRHRNPNPYAGGRQLTVFPVIKNKSTRTRENIDATWLLTEALKRDEERPESRRSNFSYFGPGVRLRALEAAIFMIGYDVSGAKISLASQ